MSRTILQPGQIEAAANIPPHLHQPSRDLFTRRGERLLQLAEGHPMGDYLRLVAGPPCSAVSSTSCRRPWCRSSAPPCR